MKKTAIKAIVPHFIAVIIFTVLSCAYFIPQLQGEKVEQHDIITFLGMSNEVTQFKKETGETSHWTNSMFGGMPTYQIASPVKSNLLRYAEKAYNLFFSRPIGYFIGLMIGMYILLLTLKVNPWLAIIGSIAFAFTTNNLVLFQAGHTSKMRAIATFAPILAGVILTYRSKYLLGGALFAISMGIGIFANHPQMIYYFGMVVAVYVLIQLFADISSGKLMNFAKASGILLLGLILSIGASYSKIASTMEYQADTMRGKPILETKGEASSSSHTNGLEWSYAMQWSNGSLDLFTSLIPGFVGGSDGEKIDGSTEFGKILKRAGQRPDRAPLYWGGLPSTSGPNYYGAGMIFLFVLSLFLIRGSFKWWVLFGVIFTILLSMGKNLEWFNRIFFEYAPLFNKFRAHSSVLAVTSLLIPLLGIFGLSRILNGTINKEQAAKFTLISGGIVGGICLLFGLMGSSLFDFSGGIDRRYLQMPQGQSIVDALISDRKSLLQSDAFRSFGIIAIFTGLIYFYLKNRLNQTILLSGLALVTIFDLMTVGKRYLNSDNFVPKSKYEANFKPRPVDEQIKKDPSLHYRVLDLSINTFVSAASSYHHKTIGGNHAAKLQRYQDMIDYHIGKGNQAVLNMLNTKYIISQEGVAQQNTNILGNAWFINNIKTVNTPNEEIESLGQGFDPAITAVVHKEFENYLSELNPNKSGSIELTDYKPNELTYKSNTGGDQLAVFSEVWYGPNKGWQAYIDDKPVDHIRANYILRALKVPSGEHTIRFEFKPQSFASGELLSLICSGLILLGFFGVTGRGLKNWYDELPEEDVIQQQTPSIKKQPLKKTVSKKKRKK